MARLAFRFTAAKGDGSGRLVGRVHTFGEMGVMQGSPNLQTFLPGAFDAVLRDPNTDARAFWQHDPRWILGRQGNGSLRLELADDGLDYELTPAPTSYAADLMALVDRGDITEMSFGIVPGKFTLSKLPDGRTLQTHSEVAALFDISPVAEGAFGATGVSMAAMRADPESPRSQAVRARHRVYREGQDNG